MRHLVVVLGDQLDRHSSALEGFDPGQDAIWMAEVRVEADKVWSHKARIALFLTAMRAYRDELRDLGHTVHYRELDQHAAPDLASALIEDLALLQPQSVVLCEPGEWAVRESLRASCARAGVALEEREDRHFLYSRKDFADWAQTRREFRLEHFYRHARRRHQVLMDGAQPAGGRWNFDQENRQSLRAGDPLPDPPQRFAPDARTQAVLDLVETQFAGHPGSLDAFDWPLTPADAQVALTDFIDQRLAGFGRWQDAMWQGEDLLWHSRLSAAMNLKLIDPRDVLAAAEQAWRDGRAPLASVEGFVRQVLGWREYVRGLYWQHMPEWLDANALAAEEPLPDFYWTGDTEMACLRDAIGQTLRTGYAHHIQRLMVTGLFALLLGVRPRQVHAWYLAVYVDAVEWVELPNVIGMSQYADGGIMASKPYCASGRYIQRMSNYCEGCRYRPENMLGPHACPFTTLYWDFLLRHKERFARHPRTALQWRNLDRLDDQTRQAVQQQAQALRDRLRTTK